MNTLPINAAHGDEELPPEPEAPDPWDGETTGLGRVTIVKRWTRSQCEAALRAIDAGTMSVQATVKRELARELDALAKVEAPDPSTIEGRDELLRLRALQSTAQRPGLVATIDELLGNVMIEGAVEAAAAATAERLLDGVPGISSADASPLPESFVEAATAIGVELGRRLEQVDLFTIDAMTRSVRSARSATKACTDSTLILIAWRHARTNTIREILARRFRALTGTEPENGVGTSSEAAASAGEAARVAVRDLRMVPLPDGTTDVWACPPGGRAQRMGKATDPQLAQAVALMRRHHAEVTQQVAPTSLVDLGSLGPWLAAAKAAGLKVSITISTDDS